MAMTRMFRLSQVVTVKEIPSAKRLRILVMQF